MASSFEEYLSDSFERARANDELYADALIAQLKIIKPHLVTHFNKQFFDDFRSYNPRAWNAFLINVSNYWYV